MDTPAYPKRPGYFANKFTRMLAKACVANELGTEAVLLLIVIAHTEDSRGYRGPVTFWNGGLMPMIGVRSESALRRVREKCEAAGWLVHIPGARGKAPAYWVTVPPQHVTWDDGPTDEGHPVATVTAVVNGAAGDWESGGKAVGIRRESGEQPAGKRWESGGPSSLCLSLPLSQEGTPSESCPEPPKPAAPAPPPEPAAPPVLTFPVTGKAREWHLTAAKLAEYEATFATLDVAAALRSARQWCVDNPGRRKTHRGMPAFCSRWLERAVNSGQHLRAGLTRSPPRQAPQPPPRGQQPSLFESLREKYGDKSKQPETPPGDP